MKIIFIVSLLLIYSNLLHAKVKDIYKVELVQVLFRHGDRTPSKIELYPTDPYDPTEYQQYGYGQLTTSGMLREYTLGKFLRKRYDDFLGDYYFDCVYGYSTDFDHTKMSLQMVLNGLYPPTPKTRWSKIIKWIPTATHYQPFEKNFLQPDTFAVCSERLSSGFLKNANIPEVAKKIASYNEFCMYVKNNTHIPSTNFFAISLIAMNLECIKHLRLPLPKWCSQKDLQKFIDLHSLTIRLYAYTDEVRKLSVGPFVRKMLQNIENSDKPDNKKKIYLYGAHDLHLGCFIYAHNLTGAPDYPTFGSAVIIEKLRGPDAQIYLRMFYWTGVTEKLIPVRVGDCSHECLLSEYVKLVSSFLPDPQYVKCNSSSSENISTSLDIMNMLFN